jgi:peptidoglycan/xylan/chitin deacetylase (PgdA/CDA1 family)
MRTVRLLLAIAASICLALLLASCASRAKSVDDPAAAGTRTSGPAKATQAVTGTQVAPTPEPARQSYYEIAFGDTLGAIAERAGVSVSTLAGLNHITDTEKIYVGQRLLLPAGVVVPTEAPIGIQEAHVPILLYHHIAALAESAGSDWYVTTVTPDAFEEQMAYLAYNGYHTVRIMDLVDAARGRRVLPPNPVVITFDDGWIDGYEGALPVLRKYGMIATFFIPAQWIGGTNSEVMSWEQLQELSRQGMEIGSHSMTHPYLTQLGPEALAWELQDSKSVLEEHLGIPIEAFAYPFGIYDDNVVAQTEAAGYQAAVTVEEGLFGSGDDLMRMPRLTPLYGDSMATFVAMLGAAATQ